MSHFTEMEVAYDQKNEAQFIAALEEQFGKGHVEVHADGAALYGYQGDNRATAPKNSKNYAPPCHIIIRRKHVGSAANDIGYRRTEDGKYVAYISEFDSGNNFNTQKQNLVTQNYSALVAERNLKKQGWVVKKTKLENGTIRITGSQYK
jgi:hypothetical protein